LLEGQLGCGRVEGGADDLRSGFGELWGSVTEPPAFDCSARGAGDGVPPQDGPTAEQVGQGEGVASLIHDIELRGSVAHLQHTPIPSAALRSRR